MRKTLLIILLLLTELSMTAKENIDPILANLRQLYIKVTPIWNHYIVFQGNMYSICNSKGIPIIPFTKEAITPGLYGYFILNKSKVIDTQGNVIFITRNSIEQVRHSTNTYKTVIASDYYSILNYKGEDVSPSGSSGLYAPFSIAQYHRGMVAFYEEANRTPRKLIGVKDTMERIIIPAIYNDVSIGTNYISGTKGDTVYLFDKTGKQLWAKKGDRCQVMYNDMIGLRLYGLWTIVGADGKLLTPYSYGKLENVNHPDVIKADNKLIDKTGKIVLDGGYNTPEPREGGWWQLGYNGNIYDEKFNLIIKAGTFRSATFEGKRYITLTNNYADNENTRTYDRILGILVNIQVEETIKNDGYIVTDLEDKEYKLVINNKIQKITEFTSIEKMNAKIPLYIIKWEEKPKEERTIENSTYSSNNRLVSLSANGYKVGLLDSNFKLMLPMKFNSIRYIDKTNIIHTDGYDGTYLYTPKGKLIAKARANSTVRSKEWIVEMSNSDSMIIADSTGVLYIGKNNTSALGVREINQYNNENFIPTLLAKTDDDGYDGIYTLAGKQLHPHTYHIVSSKMSGLTTLKKKDSLYFISHTGKMLYGGRGFSGRNCTILDSYAMLLSNENGKYGVIDAAGVTITPFIYDSFFTSYQTKEIVLVKDGQYAAIANTGYLKYPLQSSYPPTLTLDNLAGSADGHYYQITAGGYNDLGTTLPAQIKQAVYNPNNEDFIRWNTYRGQGQKSGIYNRYGKKIAYIYDNFTNYTHNNLMLVADSTKEKISMIDTSGNEVIPYIKAPKLLIANYLSIISINKNAIDTLYRIDGKTTKTDAISIDSATKQKLLEEHKSYMFGNSKTVKFSATGLKVGIAFARGTTLWDTEIDSAIEISYVFALHKKTGWGLYHPTDGWIQPATCDSISNKKGIISTYKASKKGCYNTNNNSYLPPVYDEVYSSVNRELNFHVVKQNNKFLLLNKALQPISAQYDSISTDYSMSPNISAFDSGKVIQLQLEEDGMVRPK